MENKERVKYLRHAKLIAIDPGENGGIAVYSIDEGKCVEATKMPETPQALYAFLKMYSLNSKCFLERIQGMPGQSGSAMFNFGKGYGHIEMALLALKIPTETVTPQKWQKSLQLGHRRDKSKTVWKNKLKAKAEQLFPYVGRITLAISDALLILQYAINESK